MKTITLSPGPIISVENSGVGKLRYVRKTDGTLWLQIGKEVTTNGETVIEWEYITVMEQTI